MSEVFMGTITTPPPDSLLIEREKHGCAVEVSVCPHLDFLGALDPTFDGKPEPCEDPDMVQYAVAVSPMTYSCQQ